jgi:hypothetical protein
MSRRLTTDLGDEDARPCFLWDEDLTVREVRAVLRDGPPDERLRLLAKILREARDDQVWLFTTPSEVTRLWPELAPRLGSRRPFWEFLFDAWKDR